MKLPYIIIRTADLERLQTEAADRRFWQAMSEQGDQLMDTALDVIACQRETLKQYEEAMEEMTVWRNVEKFMKNDYNAIMHQWLDKYYSLKDDYIFLCETLEQYEQAMEQMTDERNRISKMYAAVTERTAEATTKPAEQEEQAGEAHETN